LYFLGLFGGQRMVQNEPGMLIGPIAAAFGFIIDFIFNIINNFTIYHSLGFSIIFLTIIVRSLMLPLAIKTQKSMAAMQRLNPELQKIRKKYPDKDAKSQQAMNAEIQKLYADNKVNPLGGCLPMLIQMPFFFGLSFIMQQSYLYVSRLGDLYSQISTFLINHVPGYTNYVGAIGAPRVPGNATINIAEVSDLNRLLNVFSAEDWENLFNTMPEIYSQIPAQHLETLVAQLPPEMAAILNAPADQAAVYGGRLEALQQLGNYLQGLLANFPVPQDYLHLPTLLTLHEQKIAIENFFGMALTEATGIGWPGIIIPILAVATAILTSVVTMRASIVTDERAKQQQKMMLVIMPVFMGAMTIGLPAGVGIFWITSSVYQTVQQLILNKRILAPIKEEMALAELKSAKK